MYEGFYINLDRARNRRVEIEENLVKAGVADRYSRFPAIDGSTITYGPDAVPGSPALGCTLSHLSVVKASLNSDLHLHILEDDAVVHGEIERVFEAFLSRHSDEWDVLMTDCFLPPDLYLFKFLHEQYRELVSTGSITFFDISDWEFAGATSYFINAASKEKFLQMVEQSFEAAVPFDLRLRTLAKKKLLKVHVCFPFFSTLSATSSESTIAGTFDGVSPLSNYRRAFYVEPDLAGILSNLRRAVTMKHDLQMQIYLTMVRQLIDPSHVRF